MAEHKPDHLAAWVYSFAAGSLGLWSTWMSYRMLGVRNLAPDWVLLHEPLLFGAALAMLWVGTLVTVYQAGFFARGGNLPHERLR